MKLDSHDFFTKKEVEYIGLQETLAFLNKLSIENQIDAIFGFSQGAFISLFISILMEIDPEYKEAFKNLKCLILSAGFLDPYPTNKEFIVDKDLIQSILLEKKDSAALNNKLNFAISIPMLNVIGVRDDIIVKEKSQNISRLFKECEILYHDGDHIVPCGNIHIETYVKFLEKYLNK